MNRAANLIVAADDRIELAVGGTRGQINGIFFQRLTLLFGIGVFHGLATTQLLDGLFNRRFVDPTVLEEFGERALVFKRGQYKQLAGDKLIAALLRQLISNVE